MGIFNWTPGSLMALNHEAWKATCLQAAVNLRIFSFVSKKEGLSISELASSMETDTRATNMLVTALTALEFLERDGIGVKLTEFSKKYLVDDSPDYFGDVISHMSFVLPAWLKLSESVKTGNKVPRPLFSKQSEQEKYDKDRHKSFILGMYNVASLQAEVICEALDLSKVHKLLDLGGGPGTYAAYFCAKNPGLKAVVFDRPTSEPLALGVLDKLNVKDRVTFVGGDFLTSELPKGFDAVWLSQVLHGENKENAGKLVKRAADTLNPGGLIIIQEFVLNDSLDGPVGPAIFALNMLVQTDGGAAYTHSEINLMLKEAGAIEIKEVQGKFPPGNRIYVGIKK
jgi:SAM-dependent methyltransferase